MVSKGKASSSGSASQRSLNREQGKVVGIPDKCWCGAGIVTRTSKTEENPCRRYYRCWFAQTEQLRDDSHVFKWADEAFHNEIQQLHYQVSVLEEELLQLKLERNKASSSHRDIPPMFLTEDVVNEFEISVLGNVEQVMVETLRKMKMIMALVFVGCVVVVVLGLSLKK